MKIVAILPFIICIALETLQQLSYSMSGRVPTKRIQFLAIGIVFYLTTLFAWLWLLTLLPLGVATPLMGTSYVTVALASKFLFKEQVDIVRWVGIVAIISGLTLISVS